MYIAAYNIIYNIEDNGKIQYCPYSYSFINMEHNAQWFENHQG